MYAFCSFNRPAKEHVLVESVFGEKLNCSGWERTCRVEKEHVLVVIVEHVIVEKEPVVVEKDLVLVQIEIEIALVKMTYFG